MTSRTTAKMRSGVDDHAVVAVRESFEAHKMRGQCCNQVLPTFGQDNQIFLPAGDEDRALNCGQRSR